MWYSWRKAVILRRNHLISALAAAATLLTLEARADAADAPAAGESSSTEPPTVVATRRSGFLLALGLGQGLYQTSGYPNAADKIGDPKYYAASGPMIGAGFSLFIMGALTDVINFGFWFGGGGAENDHWRSSGGGGGFRVDAFPFALSKHDFKNVPVKDLGVFGQFGVGNVKLEAKHGKSPGADGAESFISTGIFLDLRVTRMLGGHLSLGPQLAYEVINSTSAERHGGAFAVRIAFYGGGP
jgi:hypothetical protein